MKKLNWIWAINIVLAVAVMAMAICYMVLDNAYVNKTTASALFVVLGLVDLFIVFKCKNMPKNKNFSILMALGLVFAAIGDVVLIDNFILGAIFFALGHVFFLVAFCFIEKFRWLDLAIGGAIFAIAMIIMFTIPTLHFGDKLAIVIVYALIISMMLGKAISNCFVKSENKLANIIIMIGAFLFFFSDMMLMFDMFSSLTSNSDIFSYLCLSTYYPAEILLASSILYTSLLKGRKSK